MRALAASLALLLAAAPVAAAPGDATRKTPAKPAKPARPVDGERPTANGEPSTTNGEPTTTNGEPTTTNGEPTTTSPALTPSAALARPLDLTPSRLFERPSLTPRGKTAERGPGLSLGDDASWKVQTAQIGAMVGLFGALTVLCKSGRCADAVSGFMPDFLTVEEGPRAVIGGPREGIRQGDGGLK
jgi:hypothetical protein